MDFPAVNKKLCTLPEAKLDIEVVKIDFSNVIFVILSTNGKMGDMVLYETLTCGVPTLPLSKRSSTYESRMLIGRDRDEAHLLAKKIATDLGTHKKVIVSSTLVKPISYSDATEICKVLTAM